MKLTVVIPAFNEARYLLRTTLETAAVLEQTYGSDAELILVDDGSSDGTREVALSAARLIRRCSVVSYPQNAGKGYAMRRGFERARGEFVAFLDADGEIRPGALLALVPHLEERRADVVVGRKVMAGPRPWHRRVMRWGVRWIGRMAFGLPVTDPQTGIKVIARRAVGPFLTTCRERGYLFDLELLAVARRGGARLREVDVEVRTVRANRIPSSAGFHYLLAASALWWRYRRPVMATAALGAPVSAAPRDGDSPARRGSGRVTAHPALVYALLSPPEEPAP